MNPLHDWNLSASEAVALQKRLAPQVQVTPLQKTPQLIAGADLSFDKGSDVVWAGIVVLSFPDLQIVEERGLQTVAPFPYVPGLLSFREAPAVLQVWEQLENKPDVLVLDGQGLAHPRRFGLACHLGLWLDLPTYGSTKTLFVGNFDDVGEERGATAELVHRGEIVGAAVRTKRKVTPVYVSVGNKMTLDDAVKLTLACDGGYRVPEPTRRAHLFVNRLRRGEE
ncbi:endonuclease V [Abditibacteriota bacterium]|nr:endonuclease V [Abditibacteriota bacterium]